MNKPRSSKHFSLRSLGVLLWLASALVAVGAAGFRCGFIGALIVFVAMSAAAPGALGVNLYALGVANNQLGALAATGILHDALGITLKRLPFIGNMASDIAPQMAGKRMPFNVQQILKNYNALQVVADRGQTGTYAVQQGQDLPGDQYFTLNNWPYISIKLSAGEVNQIVDTYQNIDAKNIAIKKLLERAFNALATYIAQGYVNLFTAANFPINYAIPVGTQTFKTLGSATDQLLLLDAANPNKPPTATLDILGYREFVNSLTTVYNEEIVGDAMRTGVANGDFSGCKGVARYNIPLVIPDSQRGFICDPQGVVMANRVPEEEMLPNDPVYVEIITDTDTGFSILYREAKDVLTGEVTRTITTMFGFAVGLNNHAIRLTIA